MDPRPKIAPDLPATQPPPEIKPLPPEKPVVPEKPEVQPGKEPVTPIPGDPPMR